MKNDCQIRAKDFSLIEFDKKLKKIIQVFSKKNGDSGGFYLWMISFCAFYIRASSIENYQLYQLNMA